MVLEEQFIRSATLLFVLLNPFFMSIYLLDLIEEMSWREFSKTFAQGAAISAAVFVFVGWVGEALFTNVLQVQFASFLVFGGLLFLVVATRFFFMGPESLRQMRGSTRSVAASIAMPFMIGPGTISASVLAGARLPIAWAAAAIIVAVLLSTVAVVVLKRVYDVIHERNQALVSRYVDVTGRIMGLVSGTIAVDMIFRGIADWMGEMAL
jgi:multiple antibiotic resistance protein